MFIDGGLQSEVVVARLLELSTNTGESFDAHYTATTEVVVEPFTIYEDASRQVVVSPGRHSFGETALSVSTGNQRAVSGGVNARFGDFFGEHATEPRWGYRVEAVHALRDGCELRLEQHRVAPGTLHHALDTTHHRGQLLVDPVRSNSIQYQRLEVRANSRSSGSTARESAFLNHLPSRTSTTTRLNARADRPQSEAQCFAASVVSLKLVNNSAYRRTSRRRSTMARPQSIGGHEWIVSRNGAPGACA